MISPITAPEQELQDAAWDAWERGDYRTAFANFSAHLPTDDTYILDALGWMLDRGKGCSKDLDQAALFYRRSADLGSRYGLLALGDVLRQSDKIDEARAIYEEGAYHGFTPSMSRLGSMLTKDGRNLDERERGIMLLKEASFKGHIFAQRALLSIDMRSATSLFGKAAILFKIVNLIIRGTAAFARDPHSEKLM